MRKVKQSIEKGDHVFGIFINLSKAFDTIDHQILARKLNHYGVRGNALLLIKSYLFNRKQCVSALGEISEQLAVIFGVPQGSCLGPLLFLIYINDISNICNSNELILFADDTNIFVKAKSKHEVYIEANIILKQLSIYTMLNKLHVNLEKSCFMYFNKTTSCATDNDHDINPPIMIGSTEIKRVSKIGRRKVKRCTSRAPLVPLSCPSRAHLVPLSCTSRAPLVPLSCTSCAPMAPMSPCPNRVPTVSK